MRISNTDRAYVLTHALPYIQKYTNKIIVIKYGGGAMITDTLKESVMSDIILLSLVGVRVVLVHGGGPEINSMLEKIGKQPQFKDGLRVTDKETVDIVQMVLAGKVNKDLVNLIQSKGGKAIGLSGADGHMIKAKMKNPDLGYVGEITKIDVQPIFDVIEKGYIPVVSTIGCDDSGNTYNINADTAAAAIAAELKAESLISMTDIEGILRDKNDPESLISRIYTEDAPALVESGIISGGMIPKVECCIKAIEGGVRKVFVINGTVPHSILIEMFTDEGIGTMFVNGEDYKKRHPELRGE
ncbi:MAG: acetylglutamate kinase [Clostridia bacterium]|nr:acetylglutamate kinase [Clostridia bacterium]